MKPYPAELEPANHPKHLQQIITRTPHLRKRGRRRLCVLFSLFHFLDLLLEQLLGAEPHWICRPILQLE